MQSNLKNPDQTPQKEPFPWLEERKILISFSNCDGQETYYEKK